MANTELLHRVLKHIKDNPDDFDPVRWHRDFAGWTLRLAGPGIEVRKDDFGVETMYDAAGNRVWITDIAPSAQVLLGLNDAQLLRLCLSGNTIDDLARLVAEFTAGVTA